MVQKKTKKPLPKFKLHGEWVQFCRPNCCCCKMMADRPEDFAERDDDKGSISADEFFKNMGVDYSTPGSIARGYRMRDDLTEQQLARKLGITKAGVIEIENNTKPVDKLLAKKLAKSLSTGVIGCSSLYQRLDDHPQRPCGKYPRPEWMPFIRSFGELSQHSAG